MSRNKYVQISSPIGNIRMEQRENTVLPHVLSINVMKTKVLLLSVCVRYLQLLCIVELTGFGIIQETPLHLCL